MNIQIDPASRVHLSAPDQQAIARTLGSLQQGFSTRDAQRLTGVYSDDADWVNAFGSRKRGGPEIVAYLRGLFADANFNAGTLVADPQISLRVLNAETVTVSGHLRIRGQRLLDGGVIEERDNHSIRVLQRQADGRWLIVSEMYMDANREPSYAGHS
ncbi:MAG: SgcJ/EcaC family oxidoreductase [Variovorax sp.]